MQLLEEERDILKKTLKSRLVAGFSGEDVVYFW